MIITVALLSLTIGVLAGLLVGWRGGYTAGVDDTMIVLAATEATSPADSLS